MCCSLLTIDNSHMGTSVVDKSRGDIDRVIAALKESVHEALESKKKA